MNNSDLIKLLDQSIDLEMNMAALYQFYHELFPEDSGFWWQLVIEEKAHAALLRSGKESFVPVNHFPESLIVGSLQSVASGNRKVAAIIKKFTLELNYPDRIEAFNTALDLERQACEIHFQAFMEKNPTNELEKIFQQLNRNDKDHEQRLIDYMNAKKIKIKSEV